MGKKISPFHHCIYQSLAQGGIIFLILIFFNMANPLVQVVERGGDDDACAGATAPWIVGHGPLLKLI